MIDLEWIIQNIDDVKRKTSARGYAFDFENLLALAEARRDAIHKAESTRAAQKRRGEAMKWLSATTDEFYELKDDLRALAQAFKELDEKRKALEAEIETTLLQLPNLIDDRTPLGATEAENVEVRRAGEIRRFPFPVQDHVTLGEGLGALHTAGKVSGARFAYLTGPLARLERALISFMLDLHTQEHGYTEMMVPYLVQAPALVGTGQLPKFEEDLFKTGDHYLIPTAEVPVTNFLREQLLPHLDTPHRYAAFSPCFRQEAGSHGRDTRGLIRMHQFHKVELVIVCKPEESEREHEALVGQASHVLELLDIPHRVIELCSGDIGFSAARCFDIEAWLPSQDRWVEISSCSNFRDFQARRAEIRFRDAQGKAQYAHTLNGSGLAVGRTMVALLENHQQEDGSIRVPEALRPYLGGTCFIETPKL
jgi:seryl-tRNA synthetase